MTKILISLGVVVGIFVIVAIWAAGTFISIGNQEIGLRNQFSAQIKANEVIFDKVWKVLQQKAGVTEKYANDFRKIYSEVMDKRYAGNDQLMFKWIQEANPNFSVDMYKDLSLSIESNRAEFARVQQKLIDIKREHDDLRLKFPSSLVCSFKGVKELELKLVTSSKTEEAFKTGKEDSVSLFK